MIPTLDIELRLQIFSLGQRRYAPVAGVLAGITYGTEDRGSRNGNRRIAVSRCRLKCTRRGFDQHPIRDGAEADG